MSWYESCGEICRDSLLVQKKAQNQSGGWFSGPKHDHSLTFLKYRTGSSKQMEVQKQKELNVLREELMAKIDQSGASRQPVLLARSFILMHSTTSHHVSGS